MGLMPVDILLNDLNFAFGHTGSVNVGIRPMCVPLATAGVVGIILLLRGMVLLVPLATAMGAVLRLRLGLHCEHRGAGASTSARPNCGGRGWTLGRPPYDCGGGGEALDHEIAEAPSKQKNSEMPLQSSISQRRLEAKHIIG